VGHVTARHSANQMSKQQFATLGLLAGAIARPDLADQFGGLAQTGLGVMFLKFGRDQEREADDLGLRYMTKEGYDGRQMLEVFHTFERLEAGSSSSRMPGWLSTHPAPEDRISRLKVAAPAGQAIVKRDEYMRHLDGLVYGPNPREGFFRGAEFFQPDMRFRVTFPQGWKTQNQRQAVLAGSEAQDALLQLSLAEGSSADAAARAFLKSQGVEGGTWRASRIGGLPAVAGEFAAASGETRVRGRGAFIEHGGRVYRLLGYSVAARYDAYDGPIEAWQKSFRPLDDPEILNVQPLRLSVVGLPDAMTLAQFQQRYPSAVEPSTLATLNQVEPAERLPRGFLAKRIVGTPVR
jgi:predicted Zn-dependent protease